MSRSTFPESLRPEGVFIRPVRSVSFPLAQGTHETHEIVLPNGWTLHISKGPGTYGGSRGLWEVLPTFNGVDAAIRGWLSDAEVADFITEVASWAEKDGQVYQSISGGTMMWMEDEDGNA